ncbi:hypothetical protein ACWC09_42025 [Streptomyces sp. NPDC001617]
MDQRSTTGAHADATPVAGATTEFEPDVMDLLVEALRGAVKRESPVVGTDTVLTALVMGDTDVGAAVAPGMRASGALSGVISGRQATVGRTTTRAAPRRPRPTPTRWRSTPPGARRSGVCASP